MGQDRSTVHDVMIIGSGAGGGTVTKLPIVGSLVRRLVEAVERRLNAPHDPV